MTADSTVRRPRRYQFSWVDAFLSAIRIAAIFFIAWGLIGSIVLSLQGEGLSSDAWRQLTVTGLAQGSMYGLIALGYSMVYGVLGFINFAHGEVFMAGAMVSYFFANAMAESGFWEDNWLAALIIVMIVAMVTSTLTVVLVERIAYKPLRNAPRLIPLITSIGVSFFLQYTFLGLFGSGFLTYPQLSGWLGGDALSIGGFTVQRVQLFVIVLAAASMAALYLFVSRTKTGRAMRAVAEDREIAGLMGINVDRTIVMTFAVGGAMAGIAGVMWALMFRQVFFLMGFLPGIKAFTAAVLGGIGNMAGAYFGGLLLGLFEALGPQVILGGWSWELPILGWQIEVPSLSQLKDVVAFSALVLVLIFRPTGLFGERLAVEERG